MRRYLLTAEFTDTDFDLGWRGKRYWFKKNAIAQWARSTVFNEKHGIDQWRWVLTDTKTNSVIRPTTESRSDA